MPNLPNLKNILITLFLGLLVGCGIGYYTKAKFSQAADLKREVTGLVETRKVDAQNMQKVAEADAALGKRQETKAQVVAAVKKEFANEKQPVKRAQSGASAMGTDQGTSSGVDGSGSQVAQGQAPVCAFDLSVADVRLLNAARKGAFDSGEPPSDAEKQTPSSVDRAEFIQNDLDIVGLYHELAEAHDELVEEVKKLQADQRKRLGLSE